MLPNNSTHNRSIRLQTPGNGQPSAAATARRDYGWRLRAVLALAVGLAAWAQAPAVRADNEGQSDLDRATEAKLEASVIGDLDEVIRLTESALEKGLDEGNTEFANALLSSTLTQRGAARAAMSVATPPTDPRRAVLRRAALDDLDRAVKIDPRQPKALLAIAQLQAMPGGDHKRLREVVEQAVKYGDDEPELQAKALLMRAVLQPDLKKKLADLDRAVQLAPGDDAVIRARGLVKADLGKLDEALADLDKSLELDPGHLPTLEAKALVLGRLKRYKEALETLEKAQEASPDSVVPLMQKARIFAQQADREGALKELDEALQRDPKNVAVLLLRAMFQEDPEKKLADLDKAVEAAPDNAAAYRARGLTYADMDKPEKALADLTRAIELDPKHGPTYEAQALLLAKLERFDEAIAALDKAAEADPKAIYPMIQKARIYGAQENYQAALDEINKALKSEPDNVGLLLMRAGIYQELDQTENALADADRARELDPDLPAIGRVRAMLLADAGRMDEAIEELKKLHQLDPKDVPILVQLGMLYNARKQFDKALDAYTAALKEDPDSWIALRGRGDSYLNNGKQKEAVADYERALTLQPEDSGILNNLAWVLATSPDAKLRDGKRAIVLAEKACELTEYKMPHILSTLGAAYAEAGDFKQAMKYSRQGVELGDEEQKKALRKELASYKEKKPWRELLVGGEPVEVDQPEPKPEPKPNAEPEAKPDAKPDVKPDAKPDENANEKPKGGKKKPKKGKKQPAPNETPDGAAPPAE